MEKDAENIPEQPVEELALAPVPDEVADEIPDGGLVPWLQVAGTFALFFNSWYVLRTMHCNLLGIPYIGRGG